MRQSHGVTGQTWQDYVQTNIFDPLAMTNTFTDKTAAEAAGLTAIHRYFFGFPVETDGEHVPGLAPTGYVYTSAAHLARYLAMYTDGCVLDGQRVLSDTGIAEMLTPATNQRAVTLQSQQFDARYGAGWFVGAFGTASDARWHQGSLPYFTTWMVLLPDTNQAVVAMINAGNQFEIGVGGAVTLAVFTFMVTPPLVVQLANDTAFLDAGQPRQRPLRHRRRRQPTRCHRRHAHLGRSPRSHRPPRRPTTRRRVTPDLESRR